MGLWFQRALGEGGGKRVHRGVEVGKGGGTWLEAEARGQNPGTNSPFAQTFQPESQKSLTNLNLNLVF